MVALLKVTLTLYSTSYKEDKKRLELKKQQIYKLWYRKWVFFPMRFMKVKYIHIEVEILEIRRQYFINNIRNRFPHKIEYYFLTKSKTKMFRKDKLVRTPTLKKNAKSNQVRILIFLIILGNLLFITWFTSIIFVLDKGK